MRKFYANDSATMNGEAAQSSTYVYFGPDVDQIISEKDKQIKDLRQNLQASNEAYDLLKKKLSIHRLTATVSP